MQQQYHSLATEAIRAFFTLQYCWLNNEEIYLHKECPHCGSAATYLIYFTNRHIQDLILAFIAKYSCHTLQYPDLLDLESFSQDYEYFLRTLAFEVNQYAKQHDKDQCNYRFEYVPSVFESDYKILCEC